VLYQLTIVIVAPGRLMQAAQGAGLYDNLFPGRKLWLGTGSVLTPCLGQGFAGIHLGLDS
jgi:hypothetical protein